MLFMKTFLDQTEQTGQTTTMDAKATDERFYTPRSSARRGYSSASSEDERFVSPRESARSVSSEENEWSTPREAPPPQPADQHQYAYAKQQPNDEYYYQHASQRPAPPKTAAPEWSAHYPSAKYVDMETAQAHELRSARHAVHAVPPPLLPVAENDIFSAARHNRVDSVAYLLDQGVPVNSRDAHGNTILSIACQNGLKRMAKLALRRGININSQNVSLPALLLGRV